MICSVLRPTVGTPACTPMVAGTTPAARSCCSASSATARLRGRGRPWVKMVDSSATTGRPSARACTTSSVTRMAGAPEVPAVLEVLRAPEVLRVLEALGGSPVMMRTLCEMPLRWGNAVISVGTARIGNQNASWAFR